MVVEEASTVHTVEQDIHRKSCIPNQQQTKATPEYCHICEAHPLLPIAVLLFLYGFELVLLLFELDLQVEFGLLQLCAGSSIVPLCNCRSVIQTVPV